MKRKFNKSKFNLKAKILFTVVTIILGFGWIGVKNSRSAYAESTSALLAVTPMSQKIILTPGEAYTGTITVLNGASATSNLNYTAKIGPYTPVRDGNLEKNKDNYGGADVTTVTNYNAMMEWVSLDKNEGTLSPNERDIINYTIKVPKDAPAGAQYISILVTEDDNRDTTKNSSSTEKATAGITSKYQLASVIFANVAGETVEKGSISENNMPSVLTTNKLEATSMVRNDGNIYTDATYTLQVWPLTSDEELCTNEEKAETSMVLPNTERYHVQTCDLPAVGIFRAKQVVKIFGEESVLEKTIFVCPVWLMILAVVIVVAIIAAIIIIIKKNKAKKSED